MQKEKTIQFWNDFYSSSITSSSSRKESNPSSSSSAAAKDFDEEEEKVPVKEWILQPTTDLLHTIHNHYSAMVKKHHNDLRIQQQQYDFSMLEIGCGTSIFGLTLWEYLLKQSSLSVSSLSSSLHTPSFIYHATDVSPVCIQQNRLRDDSRIVHTLQQTIVHKDDCHHHSFQYNHLDILHPHDSSTRQLGTKQYQFIIDKGCLDTFLFRTKSKLTSCSSTLEEEEDNHVDQKEKTYNLMTHLLHNIHSLLIDDNDHTYCGKYIIFSARSKIKPIRDFNGFSSVQKIKLDASSGVSFGDLDGMGRNHLNDHTHAVYMYICTKNCNYRVETSNVFSSLSNHTSSTTSTDTTTTDDDESCKQCQISFHDFRNGEDMVYKGKKYWYRRWKGHLLHCKDYCKT